MGCDMDIAFRGLPFNPLLCFWHSISQQTGHDRTTSCFQSPVCPRRSLNYSLLAVTSWDLEAFRFPSLAESRKPCGLNRMCLEDKVPVREDGQSWSSPPALGLPLCGPKSSPKKYQLILSLAGQIWIPSRFQQQLSQEALVPAFWVNSTFYSLVFGQRSEQIFSHWCNRQLGHTRSLPAVLLSLLQLKSDESLVSACAPRHLLTAVSSCGPAMVGRLWSWGWGEQPWRAPSPRLAGKHSDPAGTVQGDFIRDVWRTYKAYWY